MGAGKWSGEVYRTYATTTGYTSTKDVREVFVNQSVPKSLDPRFIQLRESCDGEDNPNSTPIILGLDVTGSMGEYARIIAQEKLPDLMTRILEKKPVSDPHMMFMGIDDIHSTGHGALQVSQFEADIRILEQLREIYIVGRGGGNSSESYDIPWYFAANRTKIDSYTKRGKPGFLFTFGDEEAPYELVTAAELRTVFGEGEYENVTPEQLLASAQKKYQVFHVVIEEGNYCRHGLTDVRVSWTKMLGNNALFLRNVDYLTDVVEATLQIAEGADIHQVIAESGCATELKYAFHNALRS